jgi:hypothetical protein
MHQTGLGPGIGKIFYVAKTDSAFYQKLLDDGNVGEANIFTSVKAAHDTTTASRNDIIFVLPGAYDELAELAWNKASVHMIGLGGPNMRGDWSEYNSVVYTDTTAQNYTVNITGANCIFQNLTLENYGNHADNYAAMQVNKYGCFFKNVAFHGAMAALQYADSDCGSLSIGGSGMYPYFEDCIIGQDVWGALATDGSAHLRFAATSGRPNNGHFRGCQFVSNSTTVTTALVRITNQSAWGRGWVFEKCIFRNWNDDDENLNQVFNIAAGAQNQKRSILLKDCAAYGFDEWQDIDTTIVLSNMGVATAGGGLHIEPTATIS